VEDPFTKYARAAEMRSVPGRNASGNTVSRWLDRYVLRKVAPKIEKSKPQRRCVVCSKHEKRKRHYTAAIYVKRAFGRML
jgi:hypothetical protein